MARETSMAAIERALNPPPPTEEEATTPASPLPGVEKPKATKEEKEQQAEQKRQQETIEKAFAGREGTIETRTSDVPVSRIEKVYNKFFDLVNKLWNTSRSSLEDIPTPGSLIFPLIILLVFFFLLVPVNGHTRIVWIWLVLTGNAEVAGSQESTGSTGGSGDFSFTTPPTNSQNGNQTFVFSNSATYTSEDF